MLQLTQTIWLWALAGIAVPVIIHLWNVKQGKTLKVGSIAFLTESARTPSRSLRLSELLLLLLRCLLLATLALILTKPSWEKEVDITKEKGWFLIEKGEVMSAYNKFKPQIDSLIKAGFAFHYFNENFEKTNFEDALKDNVLNGIENAASLWDLLKDLNQKVPARVAVYLFTNNKLTNFEGIKPAIDLNLKWLTYPSADTTSTWLENAYETFHDSIRIVLTNSNSNLTYNNYENITHQTSNGKFDVSLEDGKTFVSYKDTTKGGIKNSVEVDTSTTVVAIFTDKYPTDASYVKAALDAIRDFTEHKMKVQIVTNAQNIPRQYNWLFWLSESEMPASLRKKNAVIYEKGKLKKSYSTIVNQFRNQEPVASFTKIENKLRLQSIWTDGFNQQILAKETGNNVYHFYNRFNPQWTDLPWSNQFPTMLMDLIYPPRKTQNINDQRIIDEQQIFPISASGETMPKQELLQRTDLTKPLWVLAFILLLAERIISSRRKFEIGGSVAQ